MKLIIAGTRTFNDYDMLTQEVNKLNLNITEVVCGGANGADKLGERYAREHSIPVKYFIPDWSQGKKAGPIRNRQMALYGDELICFWDGISRGSQNMINQMKALNKYVHVILVNQ